MPRSLSRLCVRIFPLMLLFAFAAALNAGEVARAPQLPYDLTHVQYIERFVGSPRAKDLLSRQGFVVTDQQFRQIFEPYMPSTRATMPIFITVDSAWHTYHVLLEVGVQRLELGQANLLRRFSQRLHQVAADRKGPANAVYRDLAAFAAVGWAIQDPACLNGLAADERAVVAHALEAVKSGGQSLFFGIPLHPGNFRAAGFYTKNPELARYFAARRWYANSVFRLKSETETCRALHLTVLIESDVELQRLHRQLTATPQALVGPLDDPSVGQYAQLAAKVAQGPLREEAIPGILDDFRREARKLPGPRINDQLLMPDQFAAREEETRGLRVLGNSQVPSAILFQQTTEPAIAKRALPTGVDVFAAGPLACEAGRRVLKALEPRAATYEAVCRADCGPLPESLHGRAMQLLNLLHEPLPATAPPALRTAAWQDEQLFTALGAWSEERHTWVLHTKPAFGVGCTRKEPPGYVAPYPKFFGQLGQLARRAAALLTEVAADPDLAAVGRQWLDARQQQSQEVSAGGDTIPARWLRAGDEDDEEGVSALDRLPQALAEYFRGLGRDIEAATAIDRARAWQALDAAAKRCVTGDGVTDQDRRCMRAFLRLPQGDAAQLLLNFAALCDQLATMPTRS